MNDFMLKQFEFLLLFVKQRHHHANADVNHALGYWEEPKITGDDGVDKVNFNVADIGLTPFDASPIFSVSGAIMIPVNHLFPVGLFNH